MKQKIIATVLTVLMLCTMGAFAQTPEEVWTQANAQWAAMENSDNLASQLSATSANAFHAVTKMADGSLATGVLYDAGRSTNPEYQYKGWKSATAFQANGIVMYLSQSYGSRQIAVVSYFDVYVKDTLGTVHTLHQQGLATEGTYCLNITVPENIGLITEAGFRIWSYEEAGFASASQMGDTASNLMEISIYGNIPPSQFDQYSEAYLAMDGVKNLTASLSVAGTNFWPATSTPNMTDGDLATGALFDAGRNTSSEHQYIAWKSGTPLKLAGIVLHMDKSYGNRLIPAISFYDVYVRDTFGTVHTLHTVNLATAGVYTLNIPVPEHIGQVTEAGIRVHSYEEAGYNSADEFKAGAGDDTATCVCEIAFFGSAPMMVSQGKTVTYHSGGASSDFYSDSFKTEKAFDNDPSTFVYMWASRQYADPCWIKVDLGNPMPIEELTLIARSQNFESGEIANLEIRGSNVGDTKFEDMTLIGTTPQKDAANAIKSGKSWSLSSVASDMGTYRYIAVGNTKESRVHDSIVIAEIQIFASPAELFGNISFVDYSGKAVNRFDSTWSSRLEASISNITNMTNLTQEYTLVLAGYNENTLTAIKLHQFTVAPEESISLQTDIGFHAPEGSTKVKAMLLRSLDSAHPLVDVASVDAKAGAGAMLEPIWNPSTTTMHNEALTMIVDADTGIAEAQLFYQPTKVLSVKNSELTTTYEEGVDYTVEGDKIRLTPTSKIFSFTEAHLYTEEKASEAWGIYNSNQEVVQDPAKPKIFYRGDEYFHKRQISVTYTYDPAASGNTVSDGRWDKGTPVFVGDNMPKTMQKLRNGEDLTVVLYGDSISYGCDGSGYAKVEPYQPSWGHMLVNKLENVYGSKIKFLNTSEGGASAQQKMTDEQMQKNVLRYNPDLVILAWGMNDGVVAPAQTFKGFIQQMITKIHASNPNAEIVLVATSTPNPEAMNGSYPFKRFMQYYKEVLDELATTGIVVANIRDMQDELMERKRYIDITGNNINHPNDFFIRCHAQYFIDMFVE